MGYCRLLLDSRLSHGALSHFHIFNNTNNHAQYFLNRVSHSGFVVERQLLKIITYVEQLVSAKEAVLFAAMIQCVIVFGGV